MADLPDVSELIIIRVKNCQDHLEGFFGKQRIKIIPIHCKFLLLDTVSL